MSGLFDKTTDALGVSLNHRLLRHNITSGNIANAETPGYKAKKVDFEDSLSRALSMDGSSESAGLEASPLPFGGTSVANVKAEVYDNPDIDITNDKNTVDLEKEMSTLAENTILYRTAVELIKRKLGQLKYAVTEGGR